MLRILKMPDDDETKGCATVCGVISGILSLIFFVYLMIAFSTVNNDIPISIPEYVDMVKWVKVYSYIEFVLLGLSFFFCILTSLGLEYILHSEPVPIAMAVYIIAFFLFVYVIQLIFLAEAIPIKNNANYVCQQPYLNGNYTQMCNFYNSYYDPLFIILCILVGINSFTCLMVCISGMLIFLCLP